MESESKSPFETPDSGLQSEQLAVETSSREPAERFPNRKKLPGGVPRRFKAPYFYVDKLTGLHPTEEEERIAHDVIENTASAEFSVFLALRSVELRMLGGYSIEEFYALSEEPSRFIERYYGALGVDNVPIQKGFMLVPDDLTEKNLRGPYFRSSDENIVQLKKMLLDRNYRALAEKNTLWIKVSREVPQDEEEGFIWEVLLKTFIVHEQYHSLAPQKIELNRTGGGDLDEEAWEAYYGRMGLSYQHAINDHQEGGNALEEGLATLFEYDFRIALLDDASDMGAWYKERLKGAAEKTGMPEECLVMTSIEPDPDREGERFARFKHHYQHSVRLVKFLRDELEKRGYDFHVLAEEARIHNKTISLAKAVDAVFGRGTYRKLALAEEWPSGDKETVSVLLEELKSIVEAQIRRT